MGEKKEIKELPKFVMLGDNCALRLRNDKYYRDGGDWSVGYRVIDGELFSWKPPSIFRTSRLHRQKLTEITQEKWKKSNTIYIEIERDYSIKL